MSMSDPERSEGSVDDLYAKDTETHPSKGAAELHFTSLPHRFHAAIGRFRRRQKRSVRSSGYCCDEGGTISLIRI